MAGTDAWQTFEDPLSVEGSFASATHHLPNHHALSRGVNHSFTNNADQRTLGLSLGRWTFKKQRPRCLSISAVYEKEKCPSTLQALRKITSDLASHPRRHEWGSAVCKGCKLVKELGPEHVLSKLFVAEVRRTEKLGGNRTLELGRLFAGVPE